MRNQFKKQNKKYVQWQMRPWWSRPRRNLWHLSHRSSDWKLDSTMRWGGGGGIPAWQADGAAAVVSASPLGGASGCCSSLVERWHSSSMHTRMALWWNSSLTPIFYSYNNNRNNNTKYINKMYTTTITQQLSRLIHNKIIKDYIYIYLFHGRVWQLPSVSLCTIYRIFYYVLVTS